MGIFLGLGTTELMLLTFMLIVIFLALRVLLKTKPIQKSWLILIIIAPMGGAIIYLVYYLTTKLRDKIS